MKIKILIISLFSCSGAFSQVGIGTTNPNAELEIVKTSSNVADGILIPRINGDNLKLKDALYTSNQEGTLLYVSPPFTTTGKKGERTENVTIEGFYYFDGNHWVNIANGNEDLGNTVPYNIYNNDGVIDKTRTVSGLDYTLSFIANDDKIKNHFNVDTLFTIDTQTDRIGVRTFTPEAKFNIADQDISTSILNLDVLSDASVTASTNDKLVPLLIDKNGYVTKNGVISEILSKNNSYSVNAKYDIRDGNKYEVFTGITQGTFISFTFGTNYGFGFNRSGLLYGKITFTIYDGFQVTNWEGSAETNQSVALVNTSKSEITFNYNRGGSLKFYYADGVIYAQRTESTSYAVILTIWDGLKLR